MVHRLQHSMDRRNKPLGALPQPTKMEMDWKSPTSFARTRNMRPRIVTSDGKANCSWIACNNNVCRRTREHDENKKKLQPRLRRRA